MIPVMGFFSIFSSHLLFVIMKCNSAFKERKKEKCVSWRDYLCDLSIQVSSEWTGAAPGERLDERDIRTRHKSQKPSSGGGTFSYGIIWMEMLAHVYKFFQEFTSTRKKKFYRNVIMFVCDFSQISL